MKEAYFAAGCFWGVQYNFDKIDGIIETEVGYCGTSKLKHKPSYEEISQGNTGYSETIKIIYNPIKITYSDLCTHFFYLHNASKKNTIQQYKSAIFYKTNYQKHIAESIKSFFNAKYDVQTEILRFTKFYTAEDYHQKYYLKK